MLAGQFCAGHFTSSMSGLLTNTTIMLMTNAAKLAAISDMTITASSWGILVNFSHLQV